MSFFLIFVIAAKKKIPNTNDDISPIPPARPSTPSIRLKALIITTMANDVKIY